MNKKILILTSFILISFLTAAVSARASEPPRAGLTELPSAGLTELPSAGLTPDSPFYFLKTWKESVQTFFTFDLENKARQYLKLAEIRLAEYQKMIDKDNTKAAEKTLAKYERQLNRALQKAEQAKQKGRDVKDISQKIEEKIIEHTEVLEENLQKVPEAGKKGIEKALEALSKVLEKVKGPKDETEGWETYKIKKFVCAPKELQPIGYEIKHPSNLEVKGWEDEQIERCPVATAHIVSFIKQRTNVMTISTGMDPDEQIYKNWEEEGALPVEINGIRWLKINESRYTFSKAGYRYDISTENYSEVKELFSQILSTFRFIPKDETAGWKTYRNEEFGFEVKYPETIKGVEQYKLLFQEFNPGPQDIFSGRIGSIDLPGLSLIGFRILQKPSSFVNLDTYLKEVRDKCQEDISGGAAGGTCGIKEMKIGNKKVSAVVDIESSAPVNTGISLYLEKESNLFIILYGFSQRMLDVGDVKEKALFDTIQKILATFRFIQ